METVKKILFFEFLDFLKISIKIKFWESLGVPGAPGAPGEPTGAIKIQKIKFWDLTKKIYEKST